MIYRLLVGNLGKLNELAVGLIAGISVVWAVYSFTQGDVLGGVVAVVGGFMATILICGPVAVLLDIRDLLSEERGEDNDRRSVPR